MKARSWLGVLAAAVVVALVLSPLASSFPDGLEKVAEHLGFGGQASASSLPSPLPDYRMPGLNGGWATSVAGVLGTLLVFAVASAAARLLARRRGPGASPGGS